MKRWILLLALTSTTTTAQEPALSISVHAFDQGGPFHRRVVVVSNRDQDVVRDRRLLRFTFRAEGSRRRHTCVHPSAPRRVSEPRVARMAAGDRYEEWVDLRMYCWGRALKALSRGGEITATYGFRRRGRRQWIARVDGERRPLHRVELGGTPWGGVPVPATANDVTVALSPATVRGSWPTFRPRVRGQGRVYLRDDLWSFLVRGPLGVVSCEPQRHPVTPIVDFFVRLSRRGRSASLDASLYCPDDTFRVEGVYEVTPSLELIYDAEAFSFDAITGEFEGAPQAIRVLRRGAPYVVQDPSNFGGAHE
ncbi:MAG: hypothetical protein AAGE52_27985 [Myxococcota bacterium]